MATLRRQCDLNKGCHITDYLIIVKGNYSRYCGIQSFGVWVLLGGTIPNNVVNSPIYCYQNGNVFDIENGYFKNIKLNFIRSDFNWTESESGFVL